MAQDNEKIYEILLEIKQDIGQQIQKTENLAINLDKAVTDYGERIDKHDERICKLEEAVMKSKGEKEARKPFWIAFWDIAKLIIALALGWIGQSLFGGKTP